MAVYDVLTSRPCRRLVLSLMRSFFLSFFLSLQVGLVSDLSYRWCVLSSFFLSFFLLSSVDHVRRYISVIIWWISIKLDHKYYCFLPYNVIWLWPQFDIWPWPYGQKCDFTKIATCPTDSVWFDPNLVRSITRSVATKVIRWIWPQSWLGVTGVKWSQKLWKIFKNSLSLQITWQSDVISTYALLPVGVFRVTTVLGSKVIKRSLPVKNQKSSKTFISKSKHSRVT